MGFSRSCIGRFPTHPPHMAFRQRHQYHKCISRTKTQKNEMKQIARVFRNTLRPLLANSLKTNANKQVQNDRPRAVNDCPHFSRIATIFPYIPKYQTLTVSCRRSPVLLSHRHSFSQIASPHVFVAFRGTATGSVGRIEIACEGGERRIWIVAFQTNQCDFDVSASNELQTNFSSAETNVTAPALSVIGHFGTCLPLIAFRRHHQNITGAFTPRTNANSDVLNDRLSFSHIPTCFRIPSYYTPRSPLGLPAPALSEGPKIRIGKKHAETGDDARKARAILYNSPFGFACGECTDYVDGAA